MAVCHRQGAGHEVLAGAFLWNSGDPYGHCPACAGFEHLGHARVIRQVHLRGDHNLRFAQSALLPIHCQHGRTDFPASQGARGLDFHLEPDLTVGACDGRWRNGDCERNGC